MTRETDAEALRFDITFGLSKCRYKPPRTHDASQLDAYYRNVAASVIEQLRLSGWEFTRKSCDPYGHPTPPKVRTGSTR